MKRIFLVAIGVFTYLSLSSQPLPELLPKPPQQITKSPLNNKFVMKSEFPLTSTFRGNHSTVASYTQFIQDLTKAGSHIPDLVNINSFFDTTNVGFANQMAKDYPNNLFLQVMQANSGISRYYKPWPNSVDRICALPITFPGHWAMKVPTKITKNLNPNDTIIQVESAVGFDIGKYMPIFPNGCPALLVETEASGKVNWKHYEYVYITSISGNKLAVSRAYRDSPISSSFSRAVIAPILVTGWNEPPVWYVNFSINCPLDSNGKSAAQVLLSDLKQRFGANGSLSNFAGIDYASGPFIEAPEGIDYNLDGTVDSSDEYYFGVNQFLASIKKEMGNDFVLLAGNTNIRYIANFNGLSNEGLVQPNDPWRRISNAMNDYIFWSNHSLKPNITMQTLRIQDDSAAGVANRAKWVQLTRLGNGYATCLGACAEIKDKIFDNSTTDSNVVALTWVELFKGVENIPHWLGKPTSPLVRVASNSQSLLGKSNTDWANIIQKLSFQNGTFSILGNELLLIPDTRYNHNLTVNLKLSQSKNLTLLFDIISNGKQQFREIKNASLSVAALTNSDGVTYYTNSDFLTREFYWRHLDSTTKNCSIMFNFTGNDTIRLRSMGAYETPSAIAREFEHGVVLVNPGLEDMNFNLQELFGNKLKFTRLKAPILTVPIQWQDQYAQTIQINDGTQIQDPTNVVVPALNALFLKSEPTSSVENNSKNQKEIYLQLTHTLNKMKSK